MRVVVMVVVVVIAVVIVIVANRCCHCYCHCQCWCYSTAYPGTAPRLGLGGPGRGLIDCRRLGLGWLLRACAVVVVVVVADDVVHSVVGADTQSSHCVGTWAAWAQVARPGVARGPAAAWAQ